MSVRVDNIEDDISSIVGRLNRPTGLLGRVQPRAQEELAAQEAIELLNEFGKDAYWVACACARRAGGVLGRHWEAVTLEIERRTGRGSAATPSMTDRELPATPRKAIGSLRAALDQLAPRNMHFTRLRAYHADVPDDWYGEHSHSYGRDQYASQSAANRFDRHQEGWDREHREDLDREDLDRQDLGREDLATYDRANHSDHAVSQYRYDEELHDNTPRKRRRRGLRTTLALIGCAAVGTAGAYAYRTYPFAPPAMQTAAVQPGQAAVPAAPPAAKGAAGGYSVQVSASRNRADAQASFLALKLKFPRQLGNRTATVQRADLGAKGTYYRAMVGPFASASAADQFCGSLKAAGGECMVQRN